MDYVYGKLNKEVVSVTYSGKDTATVDMTINNIKREISANVNIDTSMSDSSNLPVANSTIKAYVDASVSGLNDEISEISSEVEENALWAKSAGGGIMAPKGLNQSGLQKGTVLISNDAVPTPGDTVIQVLPDHSNEMLIVGPALLQLASRVEPGATTYTLNLTYETRPLETYEVYNKLYYAVDTTYTKCSAAPLMPTSIAQSNGYVKLTFAKSLNPDFATAALCSQISVNGSYGSTSMVVGGGISASGGTNATIGKLVDNRGANSIVVGTQLVNDSSASIVGGGCTRNSGSCSLVCGMANYSSGQFSLVGGRGNTNMSQCAFVVGRGNSAMSSPEAVAVVGKFADVRSDTQFAVGGGSSDSNLLNLFEVHTDGRATTGADPTNAFDIATKQYVDATASGVAPIVVTLVSTGILQYTLSKTYSEIHDLLVSSSVNATKPVLFFDGNYGSGYMYVATEGVMPITESIRCCIPKYVNGSLSTLVLEYSSSNVLTMTTI